MAKTMTILAALAALVSAPSDSFAQDKPPSERGLVTMTQYLLPLAFEGVLSACASDLPEDSYLFTNASMLRQRFDEAADGTFEVARLAMFNLGGGGRGFRGQLTDDLQEISEPEFRMELESIIGQELMLAMDAEACRITNRMLEDLEPLPAENLASMLGYLFHQMALSEQSGDGN